MTVNFCDVCCIAMERGKEIRHDGFLLCSQDCLEKLEQRRKDNPFQCGKSIADLTSALIERLGDETSQNRAVHSAS